MSRLIRKLIKTADATAMHVKAHSPATEEKRIKDTRNMFPTWHQTSQVTSLPPE